MLQKYLFSIVLFSTIAHYTYCKEITINSKNTLTVLEIDSGDKVNYILRGGRRLQIELIETKAHIVFTTLDTLKKGSSGQGTIYSITCKIRIDGQEMEMVRYIPVQQSFYEPYVVNGLKIWFDALKSLSDFFNENHGDCLPQKEARFAFQDADLPICPQIIENWCPLPNKQLFVKNAYSGEDTWLGTYFGADLHGGLDINMPSNTPLWTPIDFDEHYYFNSLKAGHNNNRWRGVKHWKNKDEWCLQTHHLVQLLVREYQPIKKGQPYAFSAGVHTGYTPHTHFVFKVKQPNYDWYFIDPWILFWQIIENNKEKSNSINANIMPFSPVLTGENIQFSSEGSRSGVWGNELKYYWDFGDGYTSIHRNPVHTFVEPGIFPITLLVDNGINKDIYTQHITVNGTEINGNSFMISCNDEPSFKRRKKWKTRRYNGAAHIANTLEYKGYHNQKEAFNTKKVLIKSKNFKWEEKPNNSFRFEVIYKHGKDWLDVNSIFYEDSIRLSLQPQIDRMINKYGFYEAFLFINHENAFNIPHYVRIYVEFDLSKPNSDIIIDDSDADCIMSDYFWLSPEFHYDWSSGYNGKYFINKDNSKGEYVRYIPNLEEGRYVVKLKSPAYEQKSILSKVGGFNVIVKHKNGINKIWVEPNKSLTIGEFEFINGKENYVEIISDGSIGLIVVDALDFQKRE